MSLNATRHWIAIAALALLVACTGRMAKPPPGISFDATSQRYSVHVTDVARGELLDQLGRVTTIEIRPSPPREDRLSIDADRLDLDELLAYLLPADQRYIVRRGDREIASKTPGQDLRKQGPLPEQTAGLVAKGQRGTEPAAGGRMKAAADTRLDEQPAQVSDAMHKPAAQTLAAAGETYPKQPLGKRIARASIRITLAFEEGTAPRVVAVQSIEGGASAERFVRGPFVFALLGADGRPLEFGSFEDPLEQHSYTPEGPHSIGRARSGISGITLQRDNIDAARLLVVDARQYPMPRELDDESVRTILARSKTVLDVGAAQLMRALEQEKAK